MTPAITLQFCFWYNVFSLYSLCHLHKDSNKLNADVLQRDMALTFDRLFMGTVRLVVTPSMCPSGYTQNKKPRKGRDK